MTDLLSEAFDKVQNLPSHLQDELAAQLIEDIESELKWQKSLSQTVLSKSEQLATKALNNSVNGKTERMGFDEL